MRSICVLFIRLFFNWKERHYLYTQENYHFTNIYFNNCKVIYAVIHKVWLFITYFLCAFVCCLCLCILLMFMCSLCNWTCLLRQHINNKKLNFHHHHHLNGMNEIKSTNDVVWREEENMSNFVIHITIYSSLSNSAGTKNTNLWTTNTFNTWHMFGPSLSPAGFPF